MAQKFGNGRWVQEGFLDNRVEGTVVGRIIFAAIGPVDVYLDTRPKLPQKLSIGVGINSATPRSAPTRVAPRSAMP